MAKPLTDDERAEIVELIEQGLSRNEIALRVERSPGSITNVARDAGLSFDRAATQQATAARAADTAARMTQLASDLADDAERLRLQLFAPCVERKAMTVSAGRESGSYVEIVDVPRDQPTFSEQARIMVAVGIAVDKVHAISDQSRGDDDLSDVARFDEWLMGVGDVGPTAA